MSTDEQQNRGGFVPIGELADTLPGVIPRGRAMSAQTRHHFTTLRQVNQLIEASEAEPDLGFMARLLALCSLPRTNPGDRLQYKRVNGPYKLIMTATSDAKLPYGILPRLLLAWVCSEAVRTQRRELVLGRSLYEFMRKLGMESHSGGARGDRTRLRNQMDRLFGCSVTLIHKNASGFTRVSSFVADKHEFWWDVSRPDAPVLWDSKIELGEKFFQEIIAHPIPARLEHPQKAQAVAARPRPVPLAHLPDVQAQDAAHPRVAAALPAVRRGPGQGERDERRERLPHGLSPRAKKN